MLFENIQIKLAVVVRADSCYLSSVHVLRRDQVSLLIIVGEFFEGGDFRRECFSASCIKFSDEPFKEFLCGSFGVRLLGTADASALALLIRIVKASVPVILFLENKTSVSFGHKGSSWFCFDSLKWVKCMGA